MRVLVASLLALALATTASARTLFISPTASPSQTWSGATSPATPATIQTANASAVSGDVVYCLPSATQYPAEINPANAGAVGGRIVFVGTKGDSMAATFPNITLNRSYVTVKWVRATGHCYLSSINSGGWQTNLGDSVVQCNIGNEAYFLGAQNAVIYNNQIAGTCGFYGPGFDPINLSPEPPEPICSGDVFRRNVVSIGVIPSVHGFKMRCGTQNCTVDSNRVTGTFTPATIDGVGRITYNSYNNYFGDNRWTFEATAAFSQGNWNGFMVRDSSSGFTFVRDTLLLGLNSAFGITGRLSGSGTWGASCVNNSWSYCVFKTNTVIEAQNEFRNSTIDHCVIATSANNEALYFLENGSFPQRFSGNTITNNSFFSPRRAIRLDSSPSGTNTISRNVFYSTGASATGTGGGIFHVARSNVALTMDYNLFFSPTQDTQVGDRSIQWDTNGGHARPGFNVTASEQEWYTTRGRDQNSRHASPLFVDSTFAGLNMRLRAGSPALTMGPGGTQVGAFGAAPADACLDADRPGRVTDLVATFNPGDATVSTLETNNATGDEQYGGSRPEQLPTVYSRSPIPDLAAYRAAAQFSGIHSAWPAPGTAGVASQDMSEIDSSPTAAGPSAHGLWYIGVADSSTVNGKVSCIGSDTVFVDSCLSSGRPAAITNLVVTQSGGAPRFSFRLPGDDQWVYALGGPEDAVLDIRSSPNPITTYAEWDAASPLATQTCDGVGNATAGDQQSNVDFGISQAQGETRWYAIRANNAGSNGAWGCMSNSDSLSLPIPNYPPGTVTNLAGTAPTATTATLTWTATGADSAVGSAASWTMYRSTAQITNANYASATNIGTNSAFNEIPIHAGGTACSITTSGLSANTTYYFAVRYVDQQAQGGNVSNNAVVTTPAVGLPTAITTLSASSATQANVQLQWIATGNAGGSGTAQEYDVRYRKGGLSAATWDDTIHTEPAAAAQGETYRCIPLSWDVPNPVASGGSQSMTLILEPGETYGIAIKARGTDGWSALSNVVTIAPYRPSSSLILVKGEGGAQSSQEWPFAAENAPWEFVYGGAGGFGPYARAFLLDDSLTVDQANARKVFRKPYSSINWNAATSDSFTAVLRFRDAVAPWHKFLVEPIFGPFYPQTYADTIRNDTKYRALNRDFLWNLQHTILSNITAWPSGFAIYHALNGCYGIPCGLGAGADTTSPHALIWYQTPHANCIYSQFRSTGNPWTASAGSGFYGVNLAHRDAQGRFDVPDSIAYMIKRLYYDRKYTDVNGVQRRVYHGIMADVSSTTLDTLDAFGKPNYLRGAVAPYNYTSLAAMCVGYHEGALRMWRKIREICPEWEILASNATFGEDAATGNNGAMLEGIWTQLNGGTYETNRFRAPMGHDAYSHLYKGRPQFNTGFKFVYDNRLGGSSTTTMDAAFRDTMAWFQRDGRASLAYCSQTGAFLNHGTEHAFVGDNIDQAAGIYAGWNIDELRVNAATGQCYDLTHDEYRGWMGQPLDDGWAKESGIGGAVFVDSFDVASDWVYGNNAYGTVKIEDATTVGSGKALRVQTSRRVGENGDYFQSITSRRKFQAIGGGGPTHYTIEFDAQADTARKFSLGLLSSGGNPWQAGSGSGVRMWATPTARHFALRIPNPGGANDSVRIFLFTAGALGGFKFDNVRVFAGDSALYGRWFDNALVLSNPSTSQAKAIWLQSSMRRLTARAGVSPTVNNGSIGTVHTVAANDGLLLLPVGDAVRPAAPTNVVAVGTCGGANIQWTSPGNDSLTGTAATFEVRASTSAPVTNATWAAATLVGTGAAQSPGSTQGVGVVNLTANTAYFFGVAYIDPAANLGAVASASATTTCSAPPVGSITEYRSPTGRHRPTSSQRIR